ncbi:hypothetical protein QYM36_018603 [Artemia franciscana]|uniref:YqaJ viral recombinase domain-containing protein n=1 Tax=Artemia franciscana TaxID=6661 RepID=A0AA88H6E1_ARTSF|nr:hypothetical protein QYM36_018603 [Artemia franciscana]
MRIVVKFLGHKQVCRSKRNSHRVRMAAAALANSLGNKWHSHTYKSVFGRSPSKRIKNFSAKREKMVQCARRLIPSSYETRGGRYKACQSSNGCSVRGVLPKNDSEYGSNCQTSDLLSTEFEAAKQLYLRKMKPSIDQLKKLPVITAGQADNPKWIYKRMETFSSTRFHSICVCRPATSSARLAKEIVTGKQMYCDWQMNHGVDCEPIAFACFESKKGQVVQRSNDFGLFADKERWWLVTSPDGICDSGLVEVKTITNIQADKTIKEAAQENLVSGFFLRWDPVESRLLLKREHKYYYQIQGELNIVGKETCFLIAFLDVNDFEIVAVQRDTEFWKKCCQNWTTGSKTENWALYGENFSYFRYTTTDRL